MVKNQGHEYYLLKNLLLATDEKHVIARLRASIADMDIQVSWDDPAWEEFRARNSRSFPPDPYLPVGCVSPCLAGPLPTIAGEPLIVAEHDGPLTWAESNFADSCHSCIMLPKLVRAAAGFSLVLNAASMKLRGLTTSKDNYYKAIPIFKQCGQEAGKYWQEMRWIADSLLERFSGAAALALNHAAPSAATTYLAPEGAGFQLFIQGIPRLNRPWLPDDLHNGALKYALAKAALDADGKPVLYETLRQKFNADSIRAAAKELKDDFPEAFGTIRIGRNGAIKAVHHAALVASGR